MKIFIGNDDNSIRYKRIIVDYLKKNGFEVEDLGINSTDDNTYYADVAERTCLALLASGKGNRGILICGTGIGVCISANKIPGIYAAVGHDIYSAQRHILSNDGNVLCFGEFVIGEKTMLAILEEWLNLEYKPSPSANKIAAMRQIETKYSGT